MLKSIPCFGVGWGFWSRPTQPKVPRSVQICIWGEGGLVQTNSTQSAKICPNLHFQGSGRGVVVQTNSTQSAKIYPNLHFQWWGEGVVVQTDSTQSTKICPNLHFEGGRGWWFRQTFLKYLNGGTQGILNQKFWQLECVLHHR